MYCTRFLGNINGRPCHRSFILLFFYSNYPIVGVEIIVPRYVLTKTNYVIADSYCSLIRFVIVSFVVTESNTSTVKAHPDHFFRISSGFGRSWTYFISFVENWFNGVLMSTFSKLKFYIIFKLTISNLASLILLFHVHFFLFCLKRMRVIYNQIVHYRTHSESLILNVQYKWQTQNVNERSCIFINANKKVHVKQTSV